MKSLMLDFTTFGVGRKAYKNVVSHKDRNIGDPHGFELPGPGEYDPVSSFDLKPIGGGNCLTPRIMHSHAFPHSGEIFYKDQRETIHSRDQP